MKKLLLLTCVINKEKREKRKEKIKRTFLFCYLLFAVLSGGLVFAQEEFPNGELAETQDFIVWKDMPWALGANYEMGMNTRNPGETFASSFGVSVDRYLFTPFAAFGLLVSMHNNAADVTATEMLLNFRVNAPISPSISIFAQFGFGAFFYREEEREKDTYTMNFLAGCRIYFLTGALKGFYLEPYVRTGYPFLLSGGIAAGHWFNF